MNNTYTPSCHGFNMIVPQVKLFEINGKTAVEDANVFSRVNAMPGHTPILKVSQTHIIVIYFIKMQANATSSRVS